MGSLTQAIAGNLRAERARRSLSQTALGKQLGWSRGSISKIENEERQLSLPEILTICRTFDITLLDLLQGADPEDLATLGLR